MMRETVRGMGVEIPALRASKESSSTSDFQQYEMARENGIRARTSSKLTSRISWG